MLRELRRFDVYDDRGRVFILAELATFIPVDGVEVMDGVPTHYTLHGLEVLPTDPPGEYQIPRLGITVRESDDA